MKTTNLLRRALFTTALVAVPLSSAFLAGCAGTMTVDGYDGAYVDAPVNIETYPQYRFADGYAYEVNGTYYHQHQGRWVRYNRAPEGMVRVQGSVHTEARPEGRPEERR